MDFSDRIAALATRVKELRGHIHTEEATKTSLIMPFIQALGYDPSDPRVVEPEFTADIGSKKGEKVDYAIKRGGEVIMLMECKCVGDTLDASKAAQLHRYFHNLPSAKIGILTDGVVYKLFTDLEKPNIMDDKPFMVFDFENIDNSLVEELKKLCNDCFDVEIALCSAQDLKYLRQIKLLVAEELKNPTEELVKHFARQVFAGQLRANHVESFRERVRTAFEQHINDVINARLQVAMQGGSALKAVETPGQSEQADETPKVILGNVQGEGIETTEEEVEGYHIVKAILRELIDPARIVMRDTISYCGILLDNKNTKPICRMHFNAASVKYIETFDVEKKGTKHKLETLNDIYKHSDSLKTVVAGYDAK